MFFHVFCCTFSTKEDKEVMLCGVVMKSEQGGNSHSLSVHIRPPVITLLTIDGHIFP